MTTIMTNTNMSALETKLAELGVALTVNMPGMIGPSPWDSKREVTRFTCRIELNGRGINTTFYKGSGMSAPTLGDVMSCLLCDASFAHGSFADFCHETDSNADSIRAAITYKACRRTKRQLEAMFDAATLETLSNLEH